MRRQIISLCGTDRFSCVKMTTYKEKREIATLKRYYTIHGDGVARLDIGKAVNSPRFKKSLKLLAAIKTAS